MQHIARILVDCGVHMLHPHAVDAALWQPCCLEVQPDAGSLIEQACAAATMVPAHPLLGGRLITHCHWFMAISVEPYMID